MVLGILPVPGSPTNLDMSGERSNCACGRCRCGCSDIFTLISYFSFLSPSLCETPDVDWNTVSKGRKAENNQQTCGSSLLHVVMSGCIWSLTVWYSV